MATYWISIQVNQPSKIYMVSKFSLILLFTHLPPLGKALALRDAATTSWPPDEYQHAVGSRTHLG